MTSRSLGHRAPLLWIALPMIAGLVAAHTTGFAPVPWLLGAAAVAIAFAIRTSWRSPKKVLPALVLAMFLAGAASYALHRPHVSERERLPPREARLELRVERAFPQLDTHRVSGLATITRAEAHLHELAGQRVYFSLTLRKDTPPPLRTAVVSAIGVLASLPRNPPLDTFDGYLANAGVNFRLTRGRLLAEITPPSKYQRFCARQAERFSAILSAGVEPKRPDLAGVLRAMLLGQQHELTEEQDALFRQSGTMHVFSISGLHIAVIAGGLHALLMLLRLPRPVQFVVGMAALWLYVDITGRVPSAVRAFTMVALVQASLVLRTPRNPISALAASALLVVVFAPLQVFSASFQLSYGIVAALLLLGLPLADHWQTKLALFRDLPKATWSWFHRRLDELWRGLLAATALGISASLVSAIASVLFFGLFTPGALLANLWLIPASTLVILTGFISLLCGLVGFTGGAVLSNHAAVLVLWGIEAGVRAFAALPGAWFNASFRASWIGPAAFALVLAAMFAGYARHWRGWHRGYWAPAAVVILALLAGMKID